jgi:DNA processing protein
VNTGGSVAASHTTDRFLSLRDPALPTRINHLPDPPLGLYLRSTDVDSTLGRLCRGPVVAVVGTRRATRAGLDFTRQLAFDLAHRGAVVVSGLALGVDAAAHDGALAAGGETVAVLGSGVDRPSPARNARLATRLLERGGLVSEYPEGTEAARWRFPARNRIIAALAHAVVIVEAPERSGALITTDIALDMGRPIMAVPGSPWARSSRGSNALIRAGAALCECAEDVVAETPQLAWTEAATGTPPPPGAPEDPLHARILGALDIEPLTRDELTASIGTSVPQISSALAALEIDGLVVEDEGGRYRRGT